MRIKKVKVNRNKIFFNSLFSNLPLFLLILTVIPFRIFNVNLPLLDLHSFRQTQTATIARNFYLNGINLFQTELDVFGIGKERFLLLEFPLYEAIVTFLYNFFFFDEIWGRIVSIIFGLIAGVYLYRLVMLVFKNRSVAALSAFFFLFAPLNIWYQRTFMIESSVVCLLLTGFYYFCDWVIRPTKKNFFLGLIFLTLGFLQKGIYGPFWLIPMVVFYMKKHSLRNFLSLQPIFIMVIPLLGLFLWQHHVNTVNILNGHDFFTTSNRGHLEWNFGNLSDRLSVSMWEVRLRQILDGILLKPGLILFFAGLISIRLLDNHQLLYSWLFSQLIYLFSFFRIQSHNYYQMVIVPIMAIFMGFGLLRVVSWITVIVKKLLPKGKFANLNSTITIFFCFLYIIISWGNSSSAFAIDSSLYYRLITVRNVIPLNTYGILVTPRYDWNSMYPYYLQRKMLVVGVTDITSEKIQKWEKQGYSFIIFQNYTEYPQIFLMNSEIQRDWLEKKYKITLQLEDMRLYLVNK
ncbi:hypothetical protein FJY90_01460 [Candidatus Gottesmanbacteria bacterium]|nr:hypothetical protein [Candidatus Gottesmanbacteria bacterium]